MGAAGDSLLSDPAGRLGTDYEAGLPAAVRRGRGAFYTPIALAERLAGLALDPPTGAPGQLAVCDPSCGGGAFLLAAGRRLEALGVPRPVVARDLLWGADIDPGALATTSAAIEAWAGVAPDPAHLLVADTLAEAPDGWSGRFGAVVGNPPFLNQMETATARTAAARDRLRARFGGAASGYADSAWLFLLAALDLARPGGRVLLIQPQSVLAAEHAGPVRRAVTRAAALEGLWWSDEAVFAANVRVCAPLLRRAAASGWLPPRRSVARWQGPAVDAHPPAPAPAPTAPTWSALVAHGRVPEVALPDGSGCLGDLATATAGFRDQYYGIVPFVVDASEADDQRFPKLVTSGLVDPLHCRWGERPARFAGRPWQHPRLDRAALAAAAPGLSGWVEARLVPKVVLATQTPVLEPSVDADGTWVPSVPVIAVHAAPADLWRVAAVLVAPPVSAWALATFRGAALSGDAIKLSARQVLRIPLPPPDGAAHWDRAALAVQRGALDTAGEAMNAAYRAGNEVLAWWRGRLPLRAAPVCGEPEPGNAATR